MNAASIITKVQAEGGHIEACGGTLRLTASKPLSGDLVALIKAHKPELLVTLRQDKESDHAEAIREHLDERAAIMEHDGGLTREQAEAEAQRSLRVFHYRLIDNPNSWLVLIAPGCDLEQAIVTCRNKFGTDRILEVREYKIRKIS